MKHYILTAAIAITILLLQNFLSERKHWILGGILPFLVIPLLIWVIMSRSLTVELSMIIKPFAILFVILLGIWTEKREKLRKSELTKMRAQDIDE